VSASPKNNSGWATIFLIVFFFFPTHVISAQDPIIRVLIAHVNKARFRADGSKSIFVKGISTKQRRVNSIDIVYINNKVKYSINNNPNSLQELPHDFNLIIENGDKRGTWFKNRRYAGGLKISLKDQKLQIINYLKLEKYLKSVVGSEMPKEFPFAALQAQAIAARTYALKLIGKNKYFDVLSTQASQVYLGLESETQKVNKAVNSTKSLALFHNNKLINAVFHSSSGGMTEDSGKVWRYQLPYLKSVIDFDQNSTKYRWSNKFSSEELIKIFPDLGGLNSIQITEKSNSGRALKIILYGPNGNKNISGKILREKLQLLSTKFDVDLKFNQINDQIYENYKKKYLNLDYKIENGLAPYPLPLIPNDYFLLVQGYGAGHGVGMSQWGAKTMAQRGSSFRQILKHYYRGVEIKSY
tara:strand:- start:1136 stop:2374 length:1239 start_codon:yes stop_codon:yes gene_type:complete